MNLAETSGSSPPPKIEELENQISDGIRRIKSTWVAVGLALGTIRDERLYHPLSFDDYLASKPEWEITRRHADRIIKSAKIADAVNQTKMSDWLPDVPNESVARALDGLPLEEQAVVYSTACEIAGEGNDPTVKDVGAAISDLGRTSGSSPPEDATDVGDGDGDEDDGDYEIGGDEDDPLPSYEVVIGCRENDRRAIQLALLNFHISENPLGTKHRCKCNWDDLSDLLTSLGLVVRNLNGNIDLRVRGVE